MDNKFADSIRSIRTRFGSSNRGRNRTGLVHQHRLLSSRITFSNRHWISTMLAIPFVLIRVSEFGDASFSTSTS
jgi:hypothetical protein